MSFASAQYCAITMTLKTPTQRKYTMAMRRCIASAPRNSRRFDAKNNVIQGVNRLRFTRDAIAPYAGTMTRSSSA